MLAKKLPMTLKLRNGIIVFEAAAILHDIDAEFAVIDSVLKAKKKTKYRGTLVHGTAHHWCHVCIKHSRDCGL